MNDREELTERLIELLLCEMPGYRAEAAGFRGGVSRRRLLRSLLNVRPPGAPAAEFIRLQDELLSAETAEKGVVDISGLTPAREGIYLWQGDITRLRADAIVNAANPELLGCFYPCHGCIDNAIHSAAGVLLREECAAVMARQGHPEPPGGAKVTAAYNLPSKYVIHTVGPVVSGEVTSEDEKLLRSCCRSCLEAADGLGAASVALPCISTGEYRFPNALAASITLGEVVRFHGERPEMKIIIDVYRDEDYEIYRRLLA